MRVVTQLVIVAILVAGAGGAWWATQRSSADADTNAGRRGPPGGRAVLVEMAKVRVARVNVTVEAVGTAAANEAVVLTPKVTGIIKRIAFEEGETVLAGQVLVELDAGELVARLEEERAKHSNMARLYERAFKLFESKNIARARLDELYGDLLAAEARVRGNEARLRDYVIRAPFAGRLGLRRVSLGALVRPGDEIATLDDTSTIKVDFRVPETALSGISPGIVVEASSAAFPGRIFRGTVKTVGSRVDRVTRALELRAVIPNSDNALKPGMFLTATIIVATRDNAILVPEQSVVSSGSRHFVYAVVDGRAVRTTVELGEQSSGDIEILSGLQPDSVVVTAGVQKARDQAPVRDVNAAPTPGARRGPPSDGERRRRRAE